jgi:hypothetical protein
MIRSLGKPSFAQSWLGNHRNVHSHQGIKNMNAPQHRPDANFYQSPAVSAKAAEAMIISLFEALVREGVLKEEKAVAAFNNIPLLQGINQAHEIGLTLGNWKDKLVWRLKQKPPAAA